MLLLLKCVCLYGFSFVLVSRAIYSDEDDASDDDSWRFMANARRGSLGLPLINRSLQTANENRDRIALDISILKKQYAKLRERQKQAHIILSNAARQTVNPTSNATSQLNVNKYLAGRNAIVSNKGKRSGPLPGTIPPVRNTLPSSNPNTIVPALVKQSKYVAKQTKRIRSSSMDKSNDNEKHFKSTTTTASTDVQPSGGVLQKSHSTASSTSSISSNSDGGASTSTAAPRAPPRHRLRQESSSYSEDDSDHEMQGDHFDDASSSTSTSLCDDEACVPSSVDGSPMKKRAPSSASNYGALSDDSMSSMSMSTEKMSQLNKSQEALDDTIAAKLKKTMADALHAERPNDVPHIEQSTVSPVVLESIITRGASMDDSRSALVDEECSENTPQRSTSSSVNLNTYEKELLEEALNLPQQITSTSQLSPIADIAEYLRYSCISPLKSPASLLYLGFDSSSNNGQQELKMQKEPDQPAESTFAVNEDGVTNEYFERINQVPVGQYSLGSADEVTIPSMSRSSDATESFSTDIPSRILHSPAVEETVETSSIAMMTAVDTIQPHSPSKHTVGQWPTVIISEPFEYSHKSDVSQSPDAKPQELNDPHVDASMHDKPSESWEFLASSSGQIEPIENPDANKNTEKVLQIIAENSKILHRIMNKNISDENERQESKRLVDQMLNNQSDTIEVSDNAESNAQALADDMSREYTHVIDTWEEYDEGVRSVQTPVNTDLVKWNIEQYRHEYAGDQDEKLSTSQNDSPTQSIDHIVNSDSDYTVRNVSSCSDLMDKEDTVREIDDYLNDVVEPSNDVKDTAKTSSYSPTTTDGGSTSVRSLLLDDAIIEISKTESKFAKYIDDVAAGLVSDCDDNSDVAPLHEPLVSVYDSGAFAPPAAHDLPAEVKKESTMCLSPIDSTHPTGDISATISSIKNTIASIDTLCKDEPRSKSRDEKLEAIIKRVEQIERSKDTSIERPRPISLIIDDHRFDDSTDVKSISDVEPFQPAERYLSLPRCSRDRWRDLSPRRRNKDDVEHFEYESRVHRKKSPSDDTVATYSSYSNIRTIDSDMDKYKYETKISSSSSPQSYVSSTNSYSPGKKFEIRHTTVTSTFYDRFLSQKRERRIRMDKSPSSPIITKAYLDSLKPDYHDSSYGREDRHTRSAENSPSRKKGSLDSELPVHTSPSAPVKSTLSNSLLYPQYPALADTSKYTKSWDNIPSRFDIEHRAKKTYEFDRVKEE